MLQETALFSCVFCWKCTWWHCVISAVTVGKVWERTFLYSLSLSASRDRLRGHAEKPALPNITALSVTSRSTLLSSNFLPVWLLIFFPLASQPPPPPTHTCLSTTFLTSLFYINKWNSGEMRAFHPAALDVEIQLPRQSKKIQLCYQSVRQAAAAGNDGTVRGHGCQAPWHPSRYQTLCMKG